MLFRPKYTIDTIYNLDPQKLNEMDINPTSTVQVTPSSLDKRFMECYHHLLVNMAYINRVDEDTFQLKNGESIPISRRKRREVKQEYMHYLTTNLCENYS